MKPRVTDGLDGWSLFDVGYLRVFLEIFSSRQCSRFSLRIVRRYPPPPPFFFRGSFAGRRNGKSQKIDESAFYINIFKEISFLGFTRWQAIMRHALKCGTINSRLNFRREREKERECVFQLLTKLQLVNCLFRVSHRSRQSCGEGHRKERCKSVSRELRPLLNVVPRGQLSNPPFSTDSYPETFRQLSNRSIDPRSSSFLSLYRFLPSIVENFVTVPLSSRPSDPRSRARRINIHPRLGGIRGWHSR